MAKRPAKDQLLIEEMFDPYALARIKEEAAGDGFPLIDEDIETEYRCPACGYEWSGQPKPTGADVDAEGVE
jgi:rubrerythrin